MSLYEVINLLEKERELNRDLLARQLADEDAEIILCESEGKAAMIYWQEKKARHEQRKIDLVEEYSERDAGMKRVIDGGNPQPSEAAPNEEAADAA